ncbi:hypothetical protein TIFTF001_005802 [Ficus carica]|uniref:Uncharacterized protein n=1 Tax=Ficus carica TaxID=3494 RepID=A0AA87ZFZ5_FICCA|nr:hypothetical protein TIFTF001_005802 [Ficus carica]
MTTINIASSIPHPCLGWRRPSSCRISAAALLTGSEALNTSDGQYGPWQGLHGQIICDESEPIVAVMSSPSATSSAALAVTAVTELAMAATEFSCSSSPPSFVPSSPSLVEETRGADSSEGDRLFLCLFIHPRI